MKRILYPFCLLTGLLLVCAFSASALVPVANFTANKTSLFEGDSVTFTDQSTNTPTSWSWQATGGNPAASVVQNPIIKYLTVGQYSVSLTATNTYGSGSVTKPNFITVRPSKPNNASISRLEAPRFFVPGAYDVKVRVKNNGTNQISFLSVGWELDGVQQAPVTSFAMIDTFQSANGNDTVITLGNVNFAAGVAHTVRAWTYDPNGQTDPVTSGDTLFTVVKPSLSGTYTIGGASPDYPSVVAAVNDLNNYGVCGPVVFNIRNGTYTGNVSISDIPGASATNTILFRSENGNAALVTITYSAAGLSDMYTLQLNNAKYVKLSKLTISGTGTTYAHALEFVGTASYDTIENCVIAAPVTTSTSTYLACLYASSLTGGNNVFRNNSFTGGAYSTYFLGTSSVVQTANNVFDGNSFSNAYYYSFYVYYTLNTKCRNNTVTVSPSAYSTHYVMYLGYSDNMLEVTGNKLIGTGLTSSIYGLYIYDCDGNATTPGLIANNTVTFQTTGSVYALYSAYGSRLNFFHNTVISNSTSSSSYAAYFYHSSSSYTNITIRNNVFGSLSTSGYSLYNYDPTYVNSDYNLLYSGGISNIYKGINSINYPTLTAYKAATPGQEMNSVAYRPAIISATNLQPNPADTACWAMNGHGVQMAGDSMDMNGNARPTTVSAGAPDLGAFEFTPASTPPLAVAVPAVPAQGTTQAFLFAEDTVAKIEWTPFSTVPANISLRYYPGTIPPAIGNATNYMNAYWHFVAPGTGFNYNISLYYKDALLGTNPAEADLRMAKKSDGIPWFIYNFSMSTVNTTANMLSAAGLYDFSYFTGTDNLNPLPVELLDLTANSNGREVTVNWTTSGEVNTASFDIERSFDRNHFKQAGTVKAAGRSNGVLSYSFTDQDEAVAAAKTIYYRLKMNDLDGQYRYSKAVAVNRRVTLSGQQVSVYPNPFNGSVTLGFDIALPSSVPYSVTDISGKTVLSGTKQSDAGSSALSFTELAQLEKGVYFIRVQLNDAVSVMKVVKN